MTCSVMGSIAAVAPSVILITSLTQARDAHIAVGKNPGGITWRYQCRGIVLNDQRGAADDILGEQPRAIVTRRRDGLPIVEHGVAGVKLCRLRIGPGPMGQFR